MREGVVGPLDVLAHNGMSPWARLTALMRLERQVITVVLVYACLSGLLSLAIPLAVQSLVNTIAFETLLQPMVVLSVMLFLALAFQGFLLGLQSLLVELMQRRAFVRVALDLALRLPRVRLDALDGVHGPELVNRFFSVFTVQKAAGLLLMDGVGLLLQIVINLTLLAFYHPVLFQFDLIIMMLIGFVLFGMGRRAVQTSLVESKYKFAMAAWLEELALKVPSFKFGLAGDFALRQADHLATRYVEARRAHYHVVFRQLIGFLSLQALAASLLLGIGGYLVVQRQLSLGQLVASEFVVASVVAALVKLTKHLETFYDLLAAVDKLGNLLALPTERPDGWAIAPDVSSGMDLSCKSLSYHHDGGPPVISELDWDLVAGARVAIVARNGAGKSTLAEVLCGLREPVSGVIEVDRHNRRDLSLTAFRQQVALIRPEGVVAGTVLDNLLMGQPEEGPSQVRDSLRCVHLVDEIQALPEGLSTPLTTTGYPLSPQEATRLIFARVLIQKPRLVVIDEALDGLDVAARESVLGALLDRRAPWTVVVISSSPEVIAGIDAVYRLEAGRLHAVPPSERGRA